MTALWAMLCAMAVVGGIIGVVAGAVGTTQPAPASGLQRWRAARQGLGTTSDQRVRRRARYVVAALLGVVVWMASGVFVAAALVATAVAGVPWLLMPTKSTTTQIGQREALGEWCQRLANSLNLGMGLEQAMTSTRKNPPVELEEQIIGLADRLQLGWRPEEALREFADELNDATADKVVAALLLSTANRGPGLARALEDMAETVRDEVARRRKAESDRAKSRTSLRWMSFIVLGVIGAGFLVTDYTAPYGTLLGQLVLAGISVSFIGVLAWSRSLAHYRPIPRFLIFDPRSRVRVPPPLASAGEPDLQEAR
jgi:Flp pilus assembly protein TadB